MQQVQQSLFDYVPSTPTGALRPAVLAPRLPHGQPTTITSVLAAMSKRRDIRAVVFVHGEYAIRINAAMLRRYLATFEAHERISIAASDALITITYPRGRTTIRHDAWCIEPRRRSWKQRPDPTSTTRTIELV